jgi:hypothetical protein
LEERIMGSVKEEFKQKVTPRLWKSVVHRDFDEGDQEFLHLTNSLVEKVVNSYIRDGSLMDLGDVEKKSLVQDLWDTSQKYWWELSENAKPILEFVENLFKESRRFVSVQRHEDRFGVDFRRWFWDIV